MTFNLPKYANVVLLSIVSTCAGAALAVLLVHAQEVVLALALAAAMLTAAALVMRQLRRTDRDLARFIDAVTFGDSAQRFGRAGDRDALSLAGALDRAMMRLSEARLRLAGEAQFQAALVDTAPVAIFSVDQDARVATMNIAARRLLKLAVGASVSELTKLGERFALAVLDLEPGARRITTLLVEGVPQQAILTSAALRRSTARLRVIAVQPIQAALNDTELAVQADLLRVLTHEIMNSVTPITSLARTSAGLVTRLDGQHTPAVAKLRQAIETLATRADGIMNFVQGYRQVGSELTICKAYFPAARWVNELAGLLESETLGRGIELSLTVVPPDLSIYADRAYLTQVALNIVLNSIEAISSRGLIRISVSSPRKEAVIIDIEDDGPGIEEKHLRDVFIPFFTTKASGNGVGLSVSRHIVIAHGGSITVGTASIGGAKITIVL